MNNLMYRCSGEVETLMKKLEDTNKQHRECLQQVKSTAEDKNWKQRQLEELEGAARVVVDMVDPPEEGALDNKNLLERLREAP
jgi:hypothetical protein